MLPDGTRIRSMHTGFLNLPQFPSSALKAYTFPRLSHALLSIAMFCNQGYQAVFTGDAVHITSQYDRTPLLSGTRSDANLWNIPISGIAPSEPPLPPPLQIPPHFLGNVYPIHNKYDLMTFYHSTLGSPTQETLHRAIRGAFIPSFPGLDLRLLTRFFTPTAAIAKGHLDRHRRNYRSTLAQPSPPFSSPVILPKAPDVVYVASHTLYTDMSGSIISIANLSSYDLEHMRIRYFLLLYHPDPNYIKIVPMTSKSTAAYKEAYLPAIEFFASKGFKPRFEVLDNVLSAELAEAMRSLDIQPRLVPPGNHRVNIAEREMRTAKNHLISIVASCDPQFPARAIPLLFPQAEMTLNMLRRSRVNPSISAYEQMHGPYDFNRTPMAPPGTRAVILDDPSVRASFAPHGTDAFYIGPAMDHYRCYSFYIPSTGRTRISDSVAWFPHQPLHSAGPLPSTPSRTPIPAALINRPLLSPPSTGPHMRPRNIHGPLPSSEGASSEGAPVSAQGVPPAMAPPQLVLPATPTPASEGVLQHRRVGAPTDTPVAIIPLARETTAAPNPPARSSSRQTKGVTAARFADTPHSALSTLTTVPTISPVLPRSGKYSSQLRTPDGPRWQQAFIEELDRLVFTTRTMHVVPRVPIGRSALYASIVTSRKPQSSGPDLLRVRLTIGGNLSDYDGDRSSSTVDTTTVKCLLNAIVSDHDANDLTIDISDFYLESTFDRPEYMRLPVKLIPPEHGAHFHVAHLAESDAVIWEVVKGIYGLPQAGMLAQKAIIRLLEQHDYVQCRNTPCLFMHQTHNIQFVLWVDDFLVKYPKDQPALAHDLIAALRSKYRLKVDWQGRQYLGYHIRRNRARSSLTISMPNYVQQALADLKYVPTGRVTNSPIVYVPHSYSSAPQLESSDNSPPATSAQRHYLQRVVGKFLYYAMAVDGTMLFAIKLLSQQQASPTEQTMLAVQRFLQYASCHPHARISYTASNMQLSIHSDASFNGEANSRSRAAGVFALGAIQYNGNPDQPPIQLNGPVDLLCKTIPTICASASEAEYAALFLKAQQGEKIRQTLQDLGYPQRPTVITYDNTVSGKLALQQCKQRRSKAIALRYHWIRDRVAMGHFQLQWQPGTNNLADFLTKPHPVYHHRRMSKFFVQYI